MQFSLQLLESNSDIRQKILNALLTECERTIDKSIPDIRDKTKSALIDALKTEPEYNALKSGILKLEFGIPNTEIIDDIINKLANTINITKKTLTINNNGLSGGLTITAISSDIGDLLSDSSAMVVDTERGYSLPWLDWLLLKGNSIIVRNYTVKFGPSPASRTGEAIMVESNKNWRVPAEFVGTEKNNWTTRAIEKIENQINNIIKTAIEKNI